MRPPNPRGVKVGSDPPLPSRKYAVGVNRVIDGPLIRGPSSVSKFESKRVDVVRYPQTPKIDIPVRSRHLPGIEGDPQKQTKYLHQGSSSSAPVQKIVFCSICMASKPFNTFFAIEGCKHSYCSRCLGSYIESKINANMTKISCPDTTCKDGKLEPLACKSIITKKVFDHWCDALCESTVGERFYCPFKDCSALLMDERGQEVMQESECPHCHRLFCAHCRVPWHTGLSCGKFQETSQLGKEKKQESMLLELVKKSRWQRCPACKYYVEKISGCMFVKCR
ncbi:hypothetical protein KSP40_PGU013913 [Platanthera guangdongensis]|uniref:RBR-type E3 ubiquitin transferase n=1 Tax=Platanthera guangdongensis TaxID=2320717 RepID=A0ABR2N5G1_9ASPA